jgi:predicted CoA-binding protein
MDLKEIMQQKVYVVVGDTLNEEKYAYRIKHELIDAGYKVYCVGKELASINDVPEEIDIIDLCIHPAKGIKLMQECKKNFKSIVIQPGAESDELLAYLKEKNYSYIEGCLLVGIRLYSKNNE